MVNPSTDSGTAKWRFGPGHLCMLGGGEAEIFSKERLGNGWVTAVCNGWVTAVGNGWGTAGGVPGGGEASGEQLRAFSS